MTQGRVRYYGAVWCGVDRRHFMGEGSPGHPCLQERRTRIVEPVAPLFSWPPAPHYSVAFGWPWPAVINSRRLSLM